MPRRDIAGHETALKDEVDRQDAKLPRPAGGGERKRRPTGFWENVATELCKSRAVPGVEAKECMERYLNSTQYRLGGNA